MSTQKKKIRQKKLQVESSMKSVEKLLERLESNETSLDESLQAFEEGIYLIRAAQSTLARADQQVRTLLEKDGQPDEADFMLDEDDN